MISDPVQAGRHLYAALGAMTLAQGVVVGGLF